MLSLTACFHFFAFLSCGTLFLLLRSYKILLEIFSSLFFFLSMFLQNCPKVSPHRRRGHSQVAPHIPSQLFRMMQIGSAGVGVAVALYHRCCWMVAEPAVGHTVSRPFPFVSRKERSETMHFTVSAPSLRPSFHTPYLM